MSLDAEKYLTITVHQLILYNDHFRREKYVWHIDNSGPSVSCVNTARKRAHFMHNVKFGDSLLQRLLHTQRITSRRKSRFTLLPSSSIFQDRVWVKRKSFRLCSVGSLWSCEAARSWNIHSSARVWLRFPSRCELNMCETEAREREGEMWNVN